MKNLNVVAHPATAPSLGRRSMLGLLALAAAPIGRSAVADPAPPEATETVKRFSDALLGAMKAGERTDFNRRFQAPCPRG